MSIVLAPAHTERAFALDSQRDIVDWAVAIVRSCDAEAVVACGHSGLVLAGAIGFIAQVPVVAIRKIDEPTVSYPRIDASAVLPQAVTRWVWLDDLISTGGTYRHAREVMTSAGLSLARDPVACLFYHQARYRFDPDQTPRHVVGSRITVHCYSPS